MKRSRASMERGRVNQLPASACCGFGGIRPTTGGMMAPPTTTGKGAPVIAAFALCLMGSASPRERNTERDMELGGMGWN